MVCQLCIFKTNNKETYKFVSRFQVISSNLNFLGTNIETRKHFLNPYETYNLFWMYTILVFRENKHIMIWEALTNCILTSIKYSAQSVFFLIQILDLQSVFSKIWPIAIFIILVLNFKDIEIIKYSFTLLQSLKIREQWVFSRVVRRLLCKSYDS